MKVIVNAGLLDKVITPQQKGHKFKWQIAGQTWAMANVDGTVVPDPVPNPDPEMDVGMTVKDAIAAGFMKAGADTFSGTITKYTKPTGFTGKVVIPSKIDGVPVTKIGARAFAGISLLRNSDITEVIIPDSVIEIGEGAFQFRKLTSVTIPDLVIKIGDDAFKNNNQFGTNTRSNINSPGRWELANSLIVWLEW